MEVVKIVGGLLFWSFILAGLYLKTVETSSGSQSGSVKRNRFLVMSLLWVVVPVLGSGGLGALVADTDAPAWVVPTTIAVAILIPWLVAIRLQIKWGRDQRVGGDAR